VEIIRIPKVMRDAAEGYRLRAKSIGFVPTMGALHEGHMSLVRMARAENDIAVASIFVNPLQFGPSEDFSVYPRDLEGDTERLRKAGIDMLFLPEAPLMYPKGFATSVAVEGLSEKLCGAYRPGHFRGVATVVAKLLNITSPRRAYFGQKDFQQTVVIKRMVKDLDMAVEIMVCPTAREEDGLAMSSRNRYLSEAERKAAAVIYRALSETSEAITSGIIEGRILKGLMNGILRSEPLVSVVQYCSVYDPETLDEVALADRACLLAAAVMIGRTRLIDNMHAGPGR